MEQAHGVNGSEHICVLPKDVRLGSFDLLSKTGLEGFESKASDFKIVPNPQAYVRCSGISQSVLIMKYLIMKSISVVLSTVMLGHRPSHIYKYISRSRIICFKPTSRLPPSFSPLSFHPHKSNTGVPVLHHNTLEKCRRA